MLIGVSLSLDGRSAGWNTRVDITFDRERAAARAILRMFRRTPVCKPEPLIAAYLDALAKAFGPLEAATGDLGFSPLATLVLDASAILSLARGHARTRALVGRAVRDGTAIVVPATSLIDPQVATIAAFVADVVAIDESIVRRAADLMTAASLDRPIDALAVACAALGPAPSALVTVGTSAVGKFFGLADQDGFILFEV